MPDQFWKLTPAEYNMLIITGLEKKEDRLKEYLELATYISALVLNDKANDTYKKIKESIDFTSHLKPSQENDIYLELISICKYYEICGPWDN
jgi:hypothetical protein